MPICSCGCNQALTQRQIKRHLQDQVIPCLVTAAVVQFQTLALTISAPHLNPLKKTRSSQRYISSLPEPPSDEAPDRLGDDMCIDLREGPDEDDLAVQRAINRSQQGIWSGRHHRAVGLEDSEGKDDESDDVADEVQDGSEDDEYNEWDEEESLGNHSGLLALDQISEDFE